MLKHKTRNERVTFHLCIQVFLFKRSRTQSPTFADRRSSTIRLSGTLSRSIQVHITQEQGRRGIIVTKSPVAHGKKIVTNCDSLGCIKIETINSDNYHCAWLWAGP